MFPVVGYRFYLGELRTIWDCKIQRLVRSKKCWRSSDQAIRLLESRAFFLALQPRFEGNELICQIESLEVRSIRTCGNRLHFAKHSSEPQAQQPRCISCRRFLVSWDILFLLAFADNFGTLS